MINLLLIICSTLFDTILRVMKNILVNKSSKFIASTVNAILYLCNALLIKFIATANTFEGLIIIIPSSFFGCWIAMSVVEYYLKNKEDK